MSDNKYPIQTDPVLSSQLFYTHAALLDESKIPVAFVHYTGASIFTSIPVQTLRKKVSEKKVPFIKIGRTVLFSLPDLFVWVKHHQRNVVGGLK